MRILPPKWSWELKKFWNRTIKGEYNIKAIIRSKRGGGYLVLEDFLHPVGSDSYKRLRNGNVFKAPEYKQIDAVMGGGNLVELWNPGRGVYTPITFKEGELSANMDMIEQINWAKTKNKEMRIKYRNKKSGFEQYLPIILIVVFAVSLGIIMMMAADNWKQLGPIAEALREAAKNLNELREGGGAVTGMEPMGG